MKLILKDKLPPLKNAYTLHIAVSSGDADHEETKTYTYEDNSDGREELNSDMELLMGFFNMKLTDGSYYQRVNAAIEQRGKELGIEYPFDNYYALVGWDVTDRSGTVFAEPKEMWVTWHSPDGTVYDMDIELPNGKTYASIHRAFQDYEK